MSRLTYAELCTSPRERLEQYLREARGPTLASIAGYEFRGFNVLAAHEKVVMRVLGNLRFIKCFFPAPGSPPGEVKEPLHGYNLQVTNGGLDEPWTTVPNEEKPARKGHYRVYATRNRPGPNPYPQAVFLDYDQPENGLFSGRTIDDYVVQPDPENPDLLLGKAFTRLGVMTPASFFVLERLRKHDR
jgi:hypothetical protein